VQADGPGCQAPYTGQDLHLAVSPRGQLVDHTSYRVRTKGQHKLRDHGAASSSSFVTVACSCHGGGDTD